MKLMLKPDDRHTLNERSFEAFRKKLDELDRIEGVILVSASVLNDPTRSTERLTQRMLAVRARPNWKYRLIERKLGITDVLLGRWAYDWRFPAGSSFWRPPIFGIVAWRVQDPEPCLYQLGARKLAAASAHAWECRMRALAEQQVV
ncbi:hypothetical protein PT7_0226 [Pusillimonas sp. T7-7]|nr:hypothetical protein PT7_0226 [Pusillimonas sp. T7-7]